MTWPRLSRCCEVNVGYVIAPTRHIPHTIYYVTTEFGAKREDYGYNLADFSCVDKGPTVIHDCFELEEISRKERARELGLQSIPWSQRLRRTYVVFLHYLIYV